MDQTLKFLTKIIITSESLLKRTSLPGNVRLNAKINKTNRKKKKKQLLNINSWILSQGNQKASCKFLKNHHSTLTSRIPQPKYKIFFKPSKTIISSHSTKSNSLESFFFLPTTKAGYYNTRALSRTSEIPGIWYVNSGALLVNTTHSSLPSWKKKKVYSS